MYAPCKHFIKAEEGRSRTISEFTPLDMECYNGEVHFCFEIHHHHSDKSAVF